MCKKDASILQAMEVIEKGKERTWLVVDENQKLILVVTDGDIRRTFKGVCSFFSVIDIHDRVPIIARDSHPEQDLQYLSKWVMIIPVVNLQNKMVGILRLNDFSSVMNIRHRKVAIVGLGM